MTTVLTYLQATSQKCDCELDIFLRFTGTATAPVMTTAVNVDISNTSKQQLQRMLLCELIVMPSSVDLAMFPYNKRHIITDNIDRYNFE